jgi:hypothetical protein
MQPKEQSSAVIAEIARRAIRKTTGNEFDAFASWVRRQPAANRSSYGGPDQGFWESDEGDEE